MPCTRTRTRYNRVYQRADRSARAGYHNPPMGQIIRFRQLSRTYGAAGVSWWDWQQASTAGLEGDLDRRRQPHRASPRPRAPRSSS